MDTDLISKVRELERELDAANARAKAAEEELCRVRNMVHASMRPAPCAILDMSEIPQSVVHAAILVRKAMEERRIDELAGLRSSEVINGILRDARLYVNHGLLPEVLRQKMKSSSVL